MEVPKGGVRRPLGDITNVAAGIGKRPALQKADAGPRKAPRRDTWFDYAVRKVTTATTTAAAAAAAAAKEKEPTPHLSLELSVNRDSTSILSSAVVDDRHGGSEIEVCDSGSDSAGCEDDDGFLKGDAVSVDVGENSSGIGCLTQERAVQFDVLTPCESLRLSISNARSENEGEAPECAAGSEEGCAASAASQSPCSCSFCLKAAFMWADLQYQDARGRLSALKKSRKLARSLEGRIHAYENNVRVPPNNMKQAEEIEYGLKQQWRSLFLHTENQLVHESTHIHSILLKLKDMREDCKRDLQSISAVPVDR